MNNLCWYSSKLWELVYCHMAVFWLLQKSYSHFKHGKNVCNWALDLPKGQSYMLSQLRKNADPIPKVMSDFTEGSLEGVEDKGYVSSLVPQK